MSPTDLSPRLDTDALIAAALKTPIPDWLLPALGEDGGDFDLTRVPCGIWRERGAYTVSRRFGHLDKTVFWTGRVWSSQISLLPWLPKANNLRPEDRLRLVAYALDNQVPVTLSEEGCLTLSHLAHNHACLLASRQAELEAHLGRRVEPDEQIPITTWAMLDSTKDADFLWLVEARLLPWPDDVRDRYEDYIEADGSLRTWDILDEYDQDEMKDAFDSHMPGWEHHRDPEDVWVTLVGAEIRSAYTE